MKNIKFTDYFIPRKEFFITPIIIDICVVLFVIITLAGADIFDSDTAVLIKYGANYKPFTLDNQYWRMITACFLHIGILHLFFNLYALSYIGAMLEPLLGRTKFTLAFLVTGLAGSALSLWWNDLVVSAGASGAIFGLFGIYIALVTTNLVKKEVRNKVLANMAFLVGINLFIGMQAGFDNAGHVGGLLSGIALGYTFYPFIAFPRQKNKNILTLAGVVVIVLFFSYLAVAKSDFAEVYFNKILEEYTQHEKKALSAMDLPESSSDEDFLKAIRETALPQWEMALGAIQHADTLNNLPEELKNRGELIKKYAETRIKALQLVKTAIEEKTEELTPEIAFYSEKLEYIIRKIQGEEVADSLIDREIRVR